MLHVIFKKSFDIKLYSWGHKKVSPSSYEYLIEREDDESTFFLCSNVKRKTQNGFFFFDQSLRYF